MTESTLLKKIHVGVVDHEIRIFRNNVGKGWQGKSSFLDDGSLLIQQPRRVHFGLCKGSSDLIGFRSMTITQKMVGQRVAVFSALEVKTERGKVSDEQNQFIDTVKGLGGLAGVARTLEDANWILRK